MRARCDSWGQLPAPSERTVFQLTAGWQAIAEKAAVHSHGCCPALSLQRGFHVLLLDILRSPEIKPEQNGIT